MDLGLTNKEVLVVGIGKGIGKSIVKALIREGANVTMISRNSDILMEIEKSTDIETRDISFYSADLMMKNAPRLLSKKLLMKNHDFDVIIHNIGHHFGIRDPLAPVDDWLKVWQLNIGIAIEMNEILIPPMIKKGWGRIIHISSISAQILRGSPQYCTSKAYINAYVTTVGRFLADKGIVLSSIMPGAVEFEGGYWDEIKKTNPDKYYGFLKEHQAINRMGKPEEIAAFVLFMASVHSSFAPATNIPVDGANM